MNPTHRFLLGLLIIFLVNNFITEPIITSLVPGHAFLENSVLRFCAEIVVDLLISLPLLYSMDYLAGRINKKKNSQDDTSLRR